MKIEAYTYDSDIHCPACTAVKFGRMLTHGADYPTDEHGVRLDARDSEGNEIHPVFSTGSEADTPQHCSDCHQFLENSLTSDGYDYVMKKLLAADGDLTVLQTWLDSYGSDLDVPNDDWRDAAKELLEDVVSAIENKTNDAGRARILFRCNTLLKL